MNKEMTQTVQYTVHSLRPARSTTCLTIACKQQCFLHKEYLQLFAASPRQTHSLHLRMLLDPHNRKHLPKLGKCLPHCPCLNFCSPYFIWYQIHVMKELFVQVTNFDHCDICTCLGWAWHFVYLCWQTWPWYIKFLKSLGWIFHEKLAN